MIENHGHDKRHDLAGHSGRRRARNAPAEHEDADRVEYDVEDRAHALREHGIDRPARGLHQPLEHDLAEQAERHAAHDVQIGRAHVDDLGDFRLRGHERPTEEQAEHEEDRIAHQRQQHAVFRHLVGALVVLLAQRAGEQRVHAHARAGRHADHEVLRRKGQRHRRERLFADAAHEHAVHNVVQRLDEHGNDHRQRHGDDQLSDGHRAHFVFLLHGSHPSLHLFIYILFIIARRFPRLLRIV